MQSVNKMVEMKFSCLKKYASLRPSRRMCTTNVDGSEMVKYTQILDKNLPSLSVSANVRGGTGSKGYFAASRAVMAFAFGSMHSPQVLEDALMRLETTRRLTE